MQDVDARGHRVKLTKQEVPPDVVRLPAQRLGERPRCGPDVGQRGVPRASLGLPRGRTVVAVERIRVSLAEREHQPDVRLGGGVERDRRGIAARCTASSAGEAGGERDRQSEPHRRRL